VVLLVGSFDELTGVEDGAGADEGDQVGCVDRTPAGLGGLDEFERHGQPRGPCCRAPPSRRPRHTAKIDAWRRSRRCCLTDPERWFPNYVTGGKVGKLAILDLLGAERPDAQSAAGRGGLRRHHPSPARTGPAQRSLGDARVHLVAGPLRTRPGIAAERARGRAVLERGVPRGHPSAVQDKGQVVFYGAPGTVEEIPFYASYSYEDLIGACRRGGTRTAHKPGGQGDLVGRGARSTRRSSGATPTSSGRLLCGSSVLASSRGSRSVTPSTTAT